MNPDDDFEIDVDVEVDGGEEAEAELEDGTTEKYQKKGITSEVDLDDFEDVLNDVGLEDDPLFSEDEDGEASEGEEAADEEGEEEPAEEEPLVDDAEPTEEEKAKAKKEAERKSRATERVRQSREEVKKAKEAELKARISEHEAIGGQLSAAEALLQERQKGFEADLREAISVGDREAELTANRELTKVENQLAQLATMKTQHAAQKPEANSHSQETTNTEYEYWAEQGDKKSWLEDAAYKALPRDARIVVLPIRTTLQRIGRELVQNENYDPNSPEFFEELDLRLGLEQPKYKVLAEQGLDVLLSNKDIDASAETLKPEAKKATPKETSRTPKDKARAVPASPTPATAGMKTQGKPKTPKFDDLPEESKKIYNSSYRSKMTQDAWVKLVTKMSK